MYCLKTDHLSHRYSDDQMVLNDLNLRVEEGSIYGFLGPNGAGKTTTIRLLLGLLKKQEGSISIFGKSFEADRVGILKKTGSLIETPSIYAHLTAAENLSVLQKIYRCPKERINEVLDLVGLVNVGKKKAGQFSLGMKQRLSIAIAMLNNPSLLILDEPTNGLDPNGMIEIRELLKRLNQEREITIIISSHLLSEIERLVSHVGIIHKGNMLFQGTLNELVDKQQQASFMMIETNDNLKALQILKESDLDARSDNEKIILPFISKEKTAHINSLFVNSGLEVYQLNAVRNDLEAIFMNMVNN